MKKIALFLTVIFMINCCFASKGNILKRNVFRALHICQCRYCNLRGAALSNFTPGSQLRSENAFYYDNHYSKKGSKYIEDSGWMSCDFSGADLTNVDLSGANFRVALRGYITPLAKVDFSNATLIHADLSRTVLYGDNFSHADLSNAVLHNADLSLANFNNAKFDGADLKYVMAKIDAMHGWGVDMRKTSFVNADLTGAHLYGDFVGANFSHAKLIKATIDSSPKYSWHGVNFSYANLNGAKIKIGGKLIDLHNSGAILCHTVLPDGKIDNSGCCGT